MSTCAHCGIVRVHIALFFQCRCVWLYGYVIYTSRVRFTHTQSVIATRSVILTRINVIATFITVISTRTRVISTRRVWF
jgi:hypothetical protein